MSMNYIRTLVSGQKARYVDKELNLDLDLAYISDQVIVMGYPAAGFEGLYRNRREDVKKFLDHRHKNNYWIFSLVPIRENSYDKSYFYDRVSRYPFPDHHSPPLAILPLIVREMRIWLQGSKERVAIIHCKAGKGRSGTMACAYLISKQAVAAPPAGQSQLDPKAWAEERAEELMNEMPADDADQTNGETPPPSASPTVAGDAEAETDKTVSAVLKGAPVDTPRSMSVASNLDAQGTQSQSPITNSHQTSLQEVLDLHTSKRMKTSDTPSSKKSGEKKKPKQGVSIPSQRRWLNYWSLLLSGAGPRDFWSLPPPSAEASKTEPPPFPRVRILSIDVRMREPKGVAANVVKAVNILADKTSFGNRNAPKGRTGGEELWVSLARYDDDFVDKLESWERHSRAEDGNLGVRRPGGDHHEEEQLSNLFSSEKWDANKMVRSFARFGAQAVTKEEGDDKKPISAHHLQALSSSSWDTIRKNIEGNTKPAQPPISEDPSLEDVTQALKPEGVIVDGHREIRAKLYMGQVFFGWFWFIPAFHLSDPQVAPSTSASLSLSRKEVDFPLGFGEVLVSVSVTMEWSSELHESPAKQTSRSESGTEVAANIVAPLMS